MDIQKLIEQFENCTLPNTQWTHEAHLRVALYYLIQNDFYAGLRKMKQGIIRYNKNVPNSSWRIEYNATVTTFWCIKIKEYISSFSSEPIDSLEEMLIKSRLNNSELIKDFYKDDKLLNSEKYRAYFMPTKEVRYP